MDFVRDERIHNFILSGDYWNMHRRLLNPTVQNTKILNSFYPCMNESLKVLVGILEKKDPNEVISIYEFVEACSFDMFASKFLFDFLRKEHHKENTVPHRKHIWS